MVVPARLSVAEPGWVMVRNTFVDIRIQGRAGRLRRCQSAPALEGAPAHAVDRVDGRGGAGPSSPSKRGREQVEDHGAGLLREEGVESDGIDSTAASSHSLSVSGASPSSARSAAGSPRASPRLSAMEAFHSEVLSVAAEMVAMLQNRGLCASIEDGRGTPMGSSCVCDVVAMMTYAQVRFTDQLSSMAKRALQAIAQRPCETRRLRLLGRRKFPFTKTPDGFTARFGNLVAKRRMCHRLYDEGSCPFGQTCCYLHPSCVVAFSFATKLIPPSPEVFWEQTEPR